MRARFVAAVPAFAAVAACSLVTDTDGLVEHATTANTDGGPVRSDGSIPSSDSSGADAISSATGFCGRQPTSVAFCDDFDGEPFATKWNDIGVNTRGGGDVTLDMTLFLSAPNGFRSHLPGQAQRCAFASLEKAIRGTYKAMHGSTDVRYRAPPAVVTMMVLGFGEEDDRCEAYIDAQDGNVALYEQIYIGGSVKSDRLRATTLPFPADTWARLGADIDWPNGTATLSLGSGLQALDLLSCPFSTGNVYFQIGYACEAPNSEDREAHFDNAMVEVR